MKSPLCPIEKFLKPDYSMPGNTQQLHEVTFHSLELPLGKGLKKKEKKCCGPELCCGTIMWPKNYVVAQLC